MEKLITFDCYGTLIDTDLFYNEIGKIGSELGLDRDLMIHVFTQYEDRIMYGEAFMKFSDIIYKALLYCEYELNCGHIADQYDRVVDQCKNLNPFPEVKKTLVDIKNLGYKTALLSNSEWGIMKHNIAQMNHDFDEIILAEDVHAYKPQLPFFQQAAQKLDLSAKQHVHVAAGFWWDIAPANRLGWKKIWVNRKKKRGIQRVQPYEEIFTLDELIPYL